jgi:thiol-disulfide isomerase/thioredoxin
MTALTSRALLLSLFVATAGCEEKSDGPPPPTRDRSNAVAAGDGGASPPPKASVRPAATAATPKPPRQLCVGQTPRPAPKGAIQTAAAAGTAAPPAIAFGAGKWIWVNLWAAWCGPCKEEMPRILAWQPKLRAAGVMIDLAFVSIDDDERQLVRFLDAQPATGVRASYWLPEGTGRASWLGQLGVKETPELPVQALVNPAGQVACVIQGAVEDSDYAGIAAFLGGR